MTTGGCQTPVKDVPAEWRAALRAGRTSSRERIFELLGFLKSLRVATPVRPVETRTAGHSAQFEPMPPGWESVLPAVYPEYWQFNATAPVFLLAQRDSPPTFYKNMAIVTSDGASEFWDTLRSTSLDKKLCGTLLPTAEVPNSQPEGYDERTIAALSCTKSSCDSKMLQTQGRRMSAS